MYYLHLWFYDCTSSVYNESKTSMIETGSFKSNWLHQKHSSKMQLSLICCILFSMLSKHLEFLSFHIVHQMLAGTILHLPLFLANNPACSQLVKASVIFPGMLHAIPLRFKNNLHSCPVILQCRNRWFTVSACSPHKKHLGLKTIPLSLGSLG